MIYIILLQAALAVQDFDNIPLTISTLGELTIKLTAIEETQQIVIHGHELNVTSYKLHNKYEKPIGISKFLEYPAHQQVKYI